MLVSWLSNKINLFYAFLGNSNAQLVSVGEYYYFSMENRTHPEKAVYWFRIAANNSSKAQIYMAIMYLRGYGVEEDAEESFNWYKKAAELGDPNGQHSLGWCYQQGYGVEKNYKDAIYWWEKSAKENIPESQYGLGLAYANGEGVKKDLDKAKKFLKLSIENGCEHAKDDLFDLNGE